jgi:hypothetical protein
MVSCAPPMTSRRPSAGTSRMASAALTRRLMAAHAVAFTPTVVALIDARLIGNRIFLFVLLADREAERAVKVLLEERREARGTGR